MPRAWRFSAPFAAWQRRWARPDPPRLLSDATGALVDRRPIDWIALLSRVGSSSDRALFENLRLVEAVRAAAARDRQDLVNASPPLLVRIVTWIAAVQTMASLVLVIGSGVAGFAIAHRTPQLLLTGAFAGSALMLALATGRDVRRWSLVATFLCTASAFGRAALSGVTAPSVAEFDPILRGLWCEAFVPACLWQFALDFPRVRRFTTFDRTARQAAHAAWAFGLAVFALNGIVTLGVMNEEMFAAVLPNRPSNAFWRLFTLAVLPAVGAIFLRARRAPFSERRRVARFAAALAWGTAPFLLFGVLRTASPAIDHWFKTASSPERIWLDAVTIGALTAMPMFCTVAIVTDRPFGMRAFFRGATTRHLSAWALALATLAPLGILLLTLYRLRRVTILDVLTGPQAWILFGSAATGATLFAARRRLLAIAERRSLRPRAGADARLVRALDRLRLARGLNELCVTLAEEIRDGASANAVHVLIADATGAFVDPLSGSRSLARGTSLFAMLQFTATPLDLSSDRPLYHLLPAEECAWLATHEVELAFPLRQRDETMSAIVLVGAKRSGLAHDAADKWLVTTLATAAASVWESGHRAGPATSESDAEDAAFECPLCGRVSDSGRLSCGHSPAVVAALPLRVGSTFVIERRLASGGMGVVYLARDTSLDRDVALKTLPALRPGAIARLQREARAMASIRHEGLATIHGLEWWRDTPVLVMEYFPRGTLADVLRKGPLSTEASIRIGVELTRTLQSVHAQGLLHRDLKPSNIAMTDAGLPRVLDFGLATLSDIGHPPRLDDLPRGYVAGTLSYLPPEALTAALPSVALDLWAVSVVLLECVTGANPFAAADPNAVRQRMLLLSLAKGLAVVAAIDREFADVLARALDRRPERRFPTAEALHDALRFLIK